MAARQDHISGSTPMGATIVPGGATFRTWAPAARAVWVLGDFNNWLQNDDALLVPQGGGRWAGFFPGATDGMKYKFYIVGEGSQGHKRDPYARELENEWPNPDCILRAANSYPWQDSKTSAGPTIRSITPGTLIHWDGLATDKAMSDFHRFTRDLLWLRRAQPAICGAPSRPC
jgi:1,4-alpha-glucan branching enzyme